jgi:sec-independent protein translocase protein TatB
VFDIGFSELVLIGLIALIVLGPERLPEVARSAGRWVAKIRRFVENVKRDIDQEIKDEDLTAFKQMHAELTETRSLLQKTASDTFSSFSDAATSVAKIGTPDAPPVALPSPDAPAAAAPNGGKRKAARAARTKPAGARAVKKPAAAKSPRPKTNRITHGGRKKTRPG